VKVVSFRLTETYPITDCLPQNLRNITGVITRIQGWLDEQARTALPKSPIGQAIAYARSNWQALIRYLDAGYLAIDNNAAERAIKTVVIGRKNY
jgi:hypothetical protein